MAYFLSYVFPVVVGGLAEKRLEGNLDLGRIRKQQRWMVTLNSDLNVSRLAICLSFCVSSLRVCVECEGNLQSEKVTLGVIVQREIVPKSRTFRY